MERWHGKLAVVTGAGSGIGAAVAERLVAEGCQVVGLDVNIEAVAAAAKKLQGKPGQLHPIRTDITAEEDILKAFEWAAKNIGPVHILVNCAGIIRQAPLISGETSKWRQVINTNVLGLCICTREAVQSMIANGVDGHIVHINSASGHKVAAEHNVYSATKYAVTNLTEVLRNELRDAKTKIKITSISPGLVNTAILESIDQKSKDALKDLPCLQPADIADGIAYALSTPPHVQVHEMLIKPVGEPF